MIPQVKLEELEYIILTPHALYLEFFVGLVEMKTY